MYFAKNIFNLALYRDADFYIINVYFYTENDSFS